MPYEILLFTHLLGFALFLAGHGTSMFFLASFRRERDPDRLRPMLDLSLSALVANYIGLLLIIASGIWMGIAGGFFASGWIWTAIVVLVAIMALMIYMGVTYFGPIRTAVGLQPYRRTSQVALGPVAPPKELERLLASPKAGITMGAGILALLILLWLMVFKPF